MKHPQNNDASLKRNVRDLHQLSPWRFLWSVALFSSLWAGGLWLIVLSEAVWIRLLISLALANVAHAMTIFQHDCGHRSAFYSEWANVWFGRFLALFILMPFTTFAEVHRQHHRYLGNRDRDPDEWFYRRSAWKTHLRECLFVPYFVYLSLTWLGPTVRKTVIWELMLNVGTATTLIFASVEAGFFLVVLFGWILPVLFLAVIVNPISRGYEHSPLIHLAPNSPDRRDIFKVTVSVTNPILSFLWGNITYHVEHHLFPRVPLYRLPELATRLRDQPILRARYPLRRV